MIVCAAIKTKDGKVWALPRPARHADILRVIAFASHEPTRGEEQGFLACSVCVEGCSQDPHGLFVRRAPAEHIAREAGQLTKDLIGSVLTSEDLW